MNAAPKSRNIAKTDLVFDTGMCRMSFNDITYSFENGEMTKSTYTKYTYLLNKYPGKKVTVNFINLLINFE